MKQHLNILLLILCTSCLTKSPVVNEIEHATTIIKEVATSNRDHTKGIRKLTNDGQIHGHTHEIDKNSDKLDIETKHLMKTAKDVSKLQEENKRLEDEKNSRTNTVYTVLGVICFFIILGSWYIGNIRGVIAGIVGIFTSITITVMLHHKGVVISIFVLAVFIYFMFKRGKKTKKELVETVEHLKTKVSDKAEAFTDVKLIQSIATQKEVKKLRKK